MKSTLAVLLVLASVASPAASEVQAEIPGRSLTLPPVRDHWIFVGDQVMRRTALFDAESGRMLGLLNGGQGVSGIYPRISRERGEIYVAETVYTRHHRGSRTDVVTIYDGRTLGVLGEVVIPPKRADNGNGAAVTALLGDRFLLVFNQTPATSVSVVDLESRAFVGEIQTAGCALVFAIGTRAFGQLCGDGTAQRIRLDATGNEASRSRSERFFDPTQDPVTEKGVRIDETRWLFVSFEGHAHEVEFEGERPSAREPWSVFTDAERADDWRIGGNHHLAAHRASGRLFSVVHQGVAGSHKDGGPEIWVYDIAERARTGVIEPSNLGVAFARGFLGIEAGGMIDWLLSALVPVFEVANLAVTQDEEPLLFVGSRDLAAVGVHDAISGEHLRDLEATGLTGGLLVAP